MSEKGAIVTDTATTVGKYFKAHEAAISKALPAHMSTARLARVCVNAISQNPRLAECTPQSLFRAMVASGMLGLEPNTPLQQAFLVPFRNNSKGITEVTFMLGYKGLISMVHNSGTVGLLTAHEVYKNDTFEFEYGLDQKLVHKYDVEKDRGKFICAYAIYKNNIGGHDFEVMSFDAIEKIRNSAPSKDSPAWKNWYEEMAKKTVMKRLMKRIPVSLQMQHAVALDNAYEGDNKADIDNTLSDIIDVEGGLILDDNESNTAEEPEKEETEGVFYQEILDAGITVEKLSEYMIVTGTMNKDETLDDLNPDLQEYVRSKAKEFINDINS